MGVSTKQNKTPSTRRSAKRSRIIAELRRQILEGVYPPGSRMPTRSELEAHFGVSSVTVQRAIDSLIAEGFIYARHRQGTYVEEHPPHLSHYGLVIPHRPSDPQRWSRFYAALCNETMSLASGPTRQFSVYYGIDQRHADNDYAALLNDLQSQRLAGLIFGTSPQALAGTPILTQPGVPRVAVMDAPMEGIPAVYPDFASFLHRANDYLARRQRRRVAYLLHGPVSADEMHHPPTLTAVQLGVAPTYWTQYTTPWPAQAPRNCVELLMRAPADARPDALVICDDNLVEQATAGLVASGVRVPQDVEVVAHCNFPWPTPSAVAAKRLGFDARAIAERCLEMLEAQRKSPTTTHFAQVPAVFEDEIRRR